MSASDSTILTKDWVRDNWNHDTDRAPHLVMLVKVVHEWHIAFFPTLGAAIAGAVLYYLDASTLSVAGSIMSVWGIGYAAFFSKWWCTTVKGVSEQSSPTESQLEE